MDDGPIQLHNVWQSKISETLSLIEYIMRDDDGVVGFNLAFDSFHLCQTFTTLSLLPDKEACPEDCILEYAELEPIARDGPCLKPVSALDLMLHARKGHYQSTMRRSDIRIRRVPTALAWKLAGELEERVKLKDIYFAKRKNKRVEKWKVYDIEDEDGNIDPDFKDIVLKFAPSSALKALATDALNLPIDTVLMFNDVSISDKMFPNELGYAPFAKAIGARHNWNGAWPDVIKHHISHWSYNELAREYAKKDVHLTRELYRFFGSPPLGDDDSILACMVGTVRWHGFKVDIQGLRDLQKKTLKSVSKVVDGKDFEIPTSPAKARIYVEELMDETEKLLAFKDDSTKKTILESIAQYKVEGGLPHPAAERAKEVLAARQAHYDFNLYGKFISAGRFHASFDVIGSLSSRMGGGGAGLNSVGIKKTKEVRSKFPLAFPGFKLCGGDFDGQEVTLAEAAYGDPDLRKDLLSGKKIHALFGVHVYPDMTYEQILASSGTSDDKYTRCKSAVFAMFYGGEGYTLKTRLGVDLETADKAYQLFIQKYKQVGIARRKVFDQFCSLKQLGGIGSKIEWHEPSDYIESMFGFRRYFTLENQICKALYDLANKPPKEWSALKIKVTRRTGRIQTASGAVQSALYGAAFGLQAANMRAAANHVIQSSGATITKSVQRKIWDVQPSGIHDWLVMPFNSHDEIECPCKPEVVDKVKLIVDSAVVGFQSKVPLLKLEWKTDMPSWADK